MLGESLISDDVIVFCSSDGFFDGTKYGIFVGWILQVLLGLTGGIVLGYNDGFILVSTDVEVLGCTARVLNGFIFDTDGGSDIYIYWCLI